LGKYEFQAQKNKFRRKIRILDKKKLNFLGKPEFETEQKTIFGGN